MGCTESREQPKPRAKPPAAGQKAPAGGAAGVPPPQQSSRPPTGRPGNTLGFGHGSNRSLKSAGSGKSDRTGRDSAGGGVVGTNGNGTAARNYASDDIHTAHDTHTRNHMTAVADGSGDTHKTSGGPTPDTYDRRASAATTRPAEDEPTSPKRNTNVPRMIGGTYSVLRLLGKGSWATVYRCADSNTGTKYAVKMFSKERLSERSLQRSGRREARLLQQLRKQQTHPGISNFIAEYEDAQWLHVVVELGGVDLQRVLEGRPFREKKARVYFQQLVDAITFAHRQGVVHRDIKPANILVNEDTLTLMITDFGLGTHLPWEEGVSYNTDLHPIKEICGTPDFMAPEVLMRERKYNLFKTDVWSCGITLYAMLFGKAPWMERRSRARESEVRKGIFRNSRNADKLSRLSDLCNKTLDAMLCVNPAERATALDVLTGEWLLQAALPGRAETPITDGTPTRKGATSGVLSWETSTEVETPQLNCIPAGLCLKVVDDSASGSALKLDSRGRSSAYITSRNSAGAGAGTGSNPPGDKSASAQTSAQASHAAQSGGGTSAPPNDGRSAVSEQHTSNRSSAPPPLTAAFTAVSAGGGRTGVGATGDSQSTPASQASTAPNSRYYAYAVQWSTATVSNSNMVDASGSPLYPHGMARRPSAGTFFMPGVRAGLPSHIFPQASTAFGVEDSTPGPSGCATPMTPGHHPPHLAPTVPSPEVSPSAGDGGAGHGAVAHGAWGAGGRGSPPALPPPGQRLRRLSGQPSALNDGLATLMAAREAGVGSPVDTGSRGSPQTFAGGDAASSGANAPPVRTFSGAAQQRRASVDASARLAVRRGSDPAAGLDGDGERPIRRVPSERLTGYRRMSGRDFMRVTPTPSPTGR